MRYRRKNIGAVGGGGGKTAQTRRLTGGPDGLGELRAFAFAAATSPLDEAFLGRGHLRRLELKIGGIARQRRCHARDICGHRGHVLAAFGEAWCLGHKLEGEVW